MPTVTDSLGAKGALIRVEVGVSDKQRIQLFAAYKPIPPPQTMTALIDTGAEITCLDSRMVRRLGLNAIRGTYAINAPALSGLTFAQFFDLRLTVIHPSGNPADGLVLPNLVVAEMPLNALGFDILFGRDVLALCDFNYLGRAGTFVLSY
jgi:hypothetical protein